MPDPNSFAPPKSACRGREVIDRIGDKWSMYVIFYLAEGPKRFTELKRAVDGISQRMLTATLRALERDGILSRTMYPVMPPHVEYALTPMGHSLVEAVTAFITWAESHREEIDAARAAYDNRARWSGDPARS